MDPFWEDAIKAGHIQEVRDLLARGADVDARDPHGQTPLMLAAQAGNREIVEALIQHGANLNPTAKYGLTPLMLAIIAGHQEVAQLLAAAGADLAIKGTGAPGFAGKTAYDLAVARDMPDLAAILK